MGYCDQAPIINITSGQQIRHWLTFHGILERNWLQ
jgi:hypothetical protein